MSRTWFWVAIGGVVVTTAAVLLLVNRAESKPESTLGNMNAFKAP